MSSSNSIRLIQPQIRRRSISHLSPSLPGASSPTFISTPRLESISDELEEAQTTALDLPSHVQAGHIPIPVINIQNVDADPEDAEDFVIADSEPPPRRKNKPLPKTPMMSQEDILTFTNQGDVSQPRPTLNSRESQSSQDSGKSKRSVFSGLSLSSFPTLPVPAFPRNPSVSIGRAVTSSFRLFRTSSGSVTASSEKTLVQEQLPSKKIDLQTDSYDEIILDRPQISPTVSSTRPPSHPPSARPPLRSWHPSSSASIHTLSRLTHKFPVPSRTNSMNSDVLWSKTGDLVPQSDAFGEFSWELEVESMSVWTPHKWTLLISVIMVFTYGLLGLIFVLGVWFRTTPAADVIAILDSDILTVITLTATLLLLSSLLGLTGTLLNSRPILSFYALLLWPSFISILIVGYMSYKRCAFDLGGKLNEIWSQSLGWETRGTVQSILRCCGWYNPLHEVSFSKTCYARTNLQGCKSKLMDFERKNLEVYYTYAFGVVPVHIANIFVAMLCSNHVDRLFGKGLMPRKYRLGAADVQAHAEEILMRQSTSR